MIGKEDVEEACCFGLLSQCVDQCRSSPSRLPLSELGFDEGFGRETFCFNPCVDFADQVNCLWAELRDDPGWVVLEWDFVSEGGGIGCHCLSLGR